MLSVRSHLQGLDHDHNENRGLSSLRVSSSTTAPVWTPQSYQPSNLRFSHVDFVEDSQNDEAFVGLRKEDTAPKTDHNTSSLQLSVQTEGLRASCIIPAAEESLTRMMDLMDARREGNPLTESGAQRLESYVGNLQELRKNLKTLIENNLDNTKVLSSLLTVHDKIHDTLEAYGLLDEEEEEKEVHSTDLGQLVLFFWQLLQFLLRLCYWIAQHLWSKKTTTRSPNAKERTSEKEEQEEQVEEVCQICYGPSKLLTLPCRHSYCSECLEHYIEEEVNNGRVNICCMDLSCKAPLKDDEVAKLVPRDVYAKYERFTFLTALRLDPSTRWCPRADCNTAIRGGSSENPILTCPNCSNKICFDCGEPWHEGLTCKKFKKKHRAKDEARVNKWKNKRTKACPSCKVSIEKNKGCMHMTCTNCKYEFCWTCLENYRTHGVCQPKSIKERAMNVGIFAMVGTGVVVGGAVVLVLALPTACVALPVYGGYRLNRKIKENLRKLSNRDPN